MSDSTKDGHRERLRQRFAAGEASSRTEESLFELLLCYGIPRRDVRPLALELLERFGSLDALLSLDQDTLRQQKGLGEQSIVLMKLMDWIRGGSSATPDTHDPAAIRATGQLQLLDDALETRPDVMPAVAAFEPSQVPGEPNCHDEIAIRPTTSAEDVAPESPTLADEGGGELAPVPSRSRVGTGLFSKAVLKEGIELVPSLPDGASLAELKAFLSASLHYSSVQTRERHAGYILRRLFPAGVVDRSLLRFARHFSERQELRDVCFHRFCEAEGLMVEVMQQLVLPAISGGRLRRELIATFLASRFPNNRVVDCSQAIAQALGAAHLAKVTPTLLTFAYRDVLLPSFAFVVHSEFPEPGMYDLSLLEDNPRIRAMLWEPGRVMSAIYELRNQGFISKVSEIDSFRQFTTTLTLEQVVDRLVTEGGEHEVG